MNNFTQKKECYHPVRKRGRPTGKNRVPLSAEERRARNAQYERERRDGTAEAMRGLAAAAGCSPNMANKEILNAARELITRHGGATEEVELLLQTNGTLMAEIKELQNILAKAALGEKAKKKEISKSKKTKHKSNKKDKHRSASSEDYVQPIIAEEEVENVSLEPEPFPGIVYGDWIDPDSWTLHDPLTGDPITLEEPFTLETVEVEIDPWSESPERSQEAVAINAADPFLYGGVNTISTGINENTNIQNLTIRSV